MRTIRTRSRGQPSACGMTRRPTGTRGQAPHPWADGDIGQAMTTLYQTHYRSLVRLAALLVSDLAVAEDIVQDSFAAVHAMWQALPDTDAALAYLRRSVVRRSRSVVGRSRSVPCPQLTGIPRPGSAVVSALQALPVRQREVLVLQYFADLSEAEIASATGMSTAAVRSHAGRAMSSLRAALPPAGG